MWGICGVCTLALTVARTSSHYDRFAISVSKVFAPVRPRVARWEHKRPRLFTLEALWRLPPGWVKCCHRCLAGNTETPGCCEVDQVLLHLVVPLCCAEVEDCHHIVEVTWKTLQNYRCEESIWDYFPRFSQIQFEPFCFGEVVSHLLPWCHLETSELGHQWLNTRPFSWLVELRQSCPGCSLIRRVPSDEVDACLVKALNQFAPHHLL